MFSSKHYNQNKKKNLTKVFQVHSLERDSKVENKIVFVLRVVVGDIDNLEDTNNKKLNRMLGMNRSTDSQTQFVNIFQSH